MRITKYVHSCLLAETPDRVALFDPGVFSWKSGTFNIDKIDRIDRIVITHAHPDHLFPEFLKTVVDKFPKAHVIGNQAVQKAIKEAGIDVVLRDVSECAVAFEAPHAEIEPFGATPPNTGFHFQDKLTHPGDNNSFAETKDILAMPFIAPWGTLIDGIKLVLDLKPKYVIPIHDWQYSVDGRKWAYDLMRDEMFNPVGIKLLTPEPGEPLELD